MDDEIASLRRALRVTPDADVALKLLRVGLRSGVFEGEALDSLLGSVSRDLSQRDLVRSLGEIVSAARPEVIAHLAAGSTDACRAAHALGAVPDVPSLVVLGCRLDRAGALAREPLERLVGSGAFPAFGWLSAGAGGSYRRRSFHHAPGRWVCGDLPTGDTWRRQAKAFLERALTLDSIVAIPWVQPLLTATTPLIAERAAAVLASLAGGPPPLDVRRLAERWESDPLGR